MRRRSRAHEAGSIEADSRKAKRWGFRWQADRASQALLGAQSERWQPDRASQHVAGRPGHSSWAPRAARSSQSKPDRASQDEPGAPGAARSSQSRPDRASKGAQAALAGRPADRADACWTARRTISIWIRGWGGESTPPPPTLCWAPVLPNGHAGVHDGPVFLKGGAPWVPNIPEDN